MDYYKKYLKYKLKYLKLKGGYKTFDDVLNESNIIKTSLDNSGFVIDNDNNKKNNEKNKYNFVVYDNYFKELFNVDDLTKIKINKKVTIFSMSTGEAPMESYLCYILKSLKDVIIDLVVIEKIDQFDKYKETYDELKKLKLIDNYYSIDEYINNMKKYTDNILILTQLKTYRDQFDKNQVKKLLVKKINGYLDDMNIGDIIFCGSRVNAYTDINAVLESLTLLLATNIINNYKQIEDYLKKYNSRYHFFVFLTDIAFAMKNIKQGNIYVKLLLFDEDEFTEKFKDLSSVEGIRKLFPELFSKIDDNSKTIDIYYEDIKNRLTKYKNYDNKL